MWFCTYATHNLPNVSIIPNILTKYKVQDKCMLKINYFTSNTILTN